VGEIIHLHQQFRFEPRKIAIHLMNRYHNIGIFNSGVWQIVKRLNLNRLPSSQRHKLKLPN